jgi:hypothetical protein
MTEAKKMSLNNIYVIQYTDQWTGEASFEGNTRPSTGVCCPAHANVFALGDKS